MVLLLLRLLLLLLLRLSGGQDASRGVLGLLRVGNLQSLVVGDAGRERTSAAERGGGGRSGDLQWSLDVVAQLLRTTGRRIVRDTIHQEENVLRSAARSSCRKSDTLVHALRDVGTHCSI
jgi:hypothetical protein